MACRQGGPFLFLKGSTVKKRIAAICIAIAFIAGFGYLPTVAKNAIAYFYPGITVGNISLDLSGVYLTNVSINKGNISGNIEEILISPNKRIILYNGYVNHTSIQSSTLQERKPSQLEGFDIEAYGIDAFIDMGDSVIIAKEISYVGGSLYAHYISFYGNIKGRDVEVDGESVEVYLFQKSEVYLDRATVSFNEIEIPHVGPESFAEAYNIEAYYGQITAGEVIFSNASFENVIVSGDENAIIASGRVYSAYSDDFPVIGSYDFSTGEIFASSNNVAVTRNDEETKLSGLCIDVFNFEGFRRTQDIRGITGNFEISLKQNPIDIKIVNTCAASCSSPAFQSLRSGFRYWVYNSEHNLVEREGGPRSNNWVDMIPFEVSENTIKMEDPGFLGHQGYSVAAFENAFKMNVDEGRFVSGGSTITMQLIKNIWLYRDKEIARKVQEVLLSRMLERCFDKDQIMKLYLNVVEYGPDLYGLGDAAWHYYQTEAGAMTEKEAVCITSHFPRPRNNERCRGIENENQTD